MSIFYLGDHTRIADYASKSSRGGPTIVTIKIEVTDPYTLGDLLKQLAEASPPPRPAARSRPADRSPYQPAEKGRDERRPTRRGLAKADTRLMIEDMRGRSDE